MRGAIAAAPVRALIAIIEAYRHMVSPLRLPSCRFTPTCSQYAVDALSEYGLIRGSWLALLRLAKCGPWHAGGWDPIPMRSARGAGVYSGSGKYPDERAEGVHRVF